MKMTSKMTLPAVGLGVAAGAAVMMAMKPREKHSVQKVAGKAIQAVGEAVESFSNSMKM